MKQIGTFSRQSLSEEGLPGASGPRKKDGGPHVCSLERASPRGMGGASPPVPNCCEAVG